MENNSTTKGLKFRSKNSLTQVEEEVLHLIIDEFLTIKQIAQRRNCSLQAIYKIIRKLKEKGAYDSGLNKVGKFESSFNQNDVRLHGQEFNIKILYQDNKYQELLEKSNILFLDGNSIRLYKNSIEIYSGQSFFGQDQNIAENNSLKYWNRFFARLEHDLKVILVKPRARNIRIVNQHFARGNSEICDNATKNQERVWIFAEEDGKLCYITDDSFGFREDETVHPITAKPDRKAIDKQVNDWRLNNPPTNSEIWQTTFKNTQNQQFLTENIKQQQKVMEGIQNNQLIFAENMKSHIEAIKSLSREVKGLGKVIKTIKEENNKLKLGVQKTLFDFV